MSIDKSVAAFPIELPMPDVDEKTFMDAAIAIRLEYQRSYPWVKLDAIKVDEIEKVSSGTIYRVTTSERIEFDWTWEGALAFGPLDPKEFIRAVQQKKDDEYIESKRDDIRFWRGEVVEVDEAENGLFVLIEDNSPPVKGEFFVRPYEYLRHLNQLLNAETSRKIIRPFLDERLRATLGGVHPPINAGDPSQSITDLADMWKYGWSVLWGPPGTGKTTSIGKQVAACLRDPSERVLVVSTTNRATDEAMIKIGEKLKGTLLGDALLSNGGICRIGRAVDVEQYLKEGLSDLLRGTETDLLETVAKLRAKLKRTVDTEDRATINAEIKNYLSMVKSVSHKLLFSRSVRVVGCTNFRAVMLLGSEEFQRQLANGCTPFTTVILDEAGLVSKVGAAAVSLAASRRFMVAGDPRQLAPISRLSRATPTELHRWVATSSLSYLGSTRDTPPAVKLLQTQYRMHPEIGSFVSDYQYEGTLKSDFKKSRFVPPRILKGERRTIWCVLDHCGLSLPQIRPERPPSGKSWIREGTLKILEYLFAHDDFRAMKGLFISPFKAQAKMAADYLAKLGADSWRASTVHAQQGTEAEIVIFDVVQTGAAWAPDEWRRLINVAISRAKEFVIMLASQQEVEATFLLEVAAKFSARKVNRNGLAEVNLSIESQKNYELVTSHPDSMGARIASFKKLRPVLSRQQEELCQREINDGGPRLVRGVAGSGKTVVLANWAIRLARFLESKRNARIWIAYANSSLKEALERNLNVAAARINVDTTSLWDAPGAFRWENTIQLYHLRELLYHRILPGFQVSESVHSFNYEAAAKDALEQIKSKDDTSLCDALFIDEAQDFGAAPLRLLSRFVLRNSDSNPNSRSIYIFYDNAQNVYGREMPVWKDIGLDLRGRSAFMQESFRSTRQITELAFNLLEQFHPAEKDQPPGSLAEFNELKSRGLIEHSNRANRSWWLTRFCTAEGMSPELRLFQNDNHHNAELIRILRHLFIAERVAPSDIRIVMMGKEHRIPALVNLLKQELKGVVRGVEYQANQPYRLDQGLLVVTTPHSMKGHEAEIVVIPAIEAFGYAVSKPEWARALYVAMTRARTHLIMLGNETQAIPEFFWVLKAAFDAATRHCGRVDLPSRLERVAHLLEGLNHKERDWLTELAESRNLQFSPIRDEAGMLVAEPDFWFSANDEKYVCFGKGRLPSGLSKKLNALENCRVLKVGETIG
jgi:superfamily I DNA/RNA helicase